MKKWTLLLVLAGSLAGGALAGVVLSASNGTAATATGTTLAATTTGTTPSTAKSNEDPTHETNESATREADENSGKFHGGRRGHGGAFKPNENATHETGESAARESQETAGKAPPQPSAAIRRANASAFARRDRLTPLAGVSRATAAKVSRPRRPARRTGRRSSPPAGGYVELLLRAPLPA
jgi:hypothetical protein